MRVRNFLLGIGLAVASILGYEAYSDHSPRMWSDQNAPFVSQAQAQVSCPTSLPPAANFTGGTVTQGQFKTNLTNLVSYLTCLLDTPGTTSAAKTKLGLSTVASTGSYTDLINTPAAVPVGTVFPYVGTSAPTGFLFANGQCVSQATYAALFTVTGSGWGSCSAGLFAVPDLRGRTAFGVDNMGGIGAANVLGSNSSAGGCAGTVALATKCGAQAHTPTVSETAAHTHGAGTLALNGLSFGPMSDASGTNFVGASNAPRQAQDSQNSPSGFNTLTSSFVSGPIAGSTASVGSTTAFNITPPALVMNYIIKYQ